MRASERIALLRLCHYGAGGAIANFRLTRVPNPPFAYACEECSAPLVFTDQELITRVTPLPTWHDLLRHTFGIEARGCRECDRPMQGLAVMQQSWVIRQMLRHLR